MKGNGHHGRSREQGDHVRDHESDYPSRHPIGDPQGKSGQQNGEIGDGHVSRRSLS